MKSIACSIKGTILLIFINLVPAINLLAQPFGIPVKMGAFPVGFKSYWKIDHSRILNVSNLDSTLKKEDVPARPVLVNVWYPAIHSNDTTSMQYGKYLQPLDDKNVPANFLELYGRYNNETAVKEIFGKEEAKLTAPEKEILKIVLATKTNALYKAKAINKKFPVIFYHQGNGASLDDNILLCELLASHGYVVVNSSYLHADGKTWGVDGRMASVADISFIISNLSSWETNIDMQHIGMVGHSAGAQAAHLTMAQGSLPVKAMVSLETTQEYHTLSVKLWKTFVNPTLQGIGKIKGDLLFIAAPGAIFQLADSMKNANRYYFTIPDVGHNDYISQGIIHNYVSKLVTVSNKTEERFKRVSDDYRSICDLVLKFMNDKLKNSNAEFESYVVKNVSCNKVSEACMEWMPVGKTKADPYLNSSAAPTVRQFRHLIEETPDAAIAMLKRFHSDNIKYTLYDFTYSYAIIYSLLETGNELQAKALYKTYKQLLGKPFVDDFKGKCEFFEMFNKEVVKYNCFGKLKILEEADQN
jgi:hypothetical protein